MIFALESGLTTPCFSGIKDGVETEGEERPKRVGAAAKAEERREFGPAGGAQEIRRVWVKRRLSTTSSSSSSSSKKQLLGSTSGK
jgi:hypothetical protein